MTQEVLKLPKGIVNAYFCEDESDFYKLFYSEMTVHASDEDEAMEFLLGARILLHEYLALVLQGKIQPYELSEKWVEREQSGFREMMHNINEEFTQMGVPMKETKNGKLTVDLDAVEKMKGKNG